MNTPELLTICYTGGCLYLLACYWANAPKRRWIQEQLIRPDVGLKPAPQVSDKSEEDDAVTDADKHPKWTEIHPMRLGVAKRLAAKQSTVSNLRFFTEADAVGGKAPAGKPEDGLSPLQYCGTVAWQRPERRGPRLGSRRDGTLNHRTHRLGRWLAVNNVIQ